MKYRQAYDKLESILHRNLYLQDRFEPGTYGLMFSGREIGLRKGFHIRIPGKSMLQPVSIGKTPREEVECKTKYIPMLSYYLPRNSQRTALFQRKMIKVIFLNHLLRKYFKHWDICYV